MLLQRLLQQRPTLPGKARKSNEAVSAYPIASNIFTYILIYIFTFFFIKTVLDLDVLFKKVIKKNCISAITYIVNKPIFFGDDCMIFRDTKGKLFFPDQSLLKDKPVVGRYLRYPV
jgi:hypothetical protein